MSKLCGDTVCMSVPHTFTWHNKISFFTSAERQRLCYHLYRWKGRDREVCYIAFHITLIRFITPVQNYFFLCSLASWIAEISTNNWSFMITSCNFKNKYVIFRTRVKHKCQIFAWFNSQWLTIRSKRAQFEHLAGRWLISHENTAIRMPQMARMQSNSTHVGFDSFTWTLLSWTSCFMTSCVITLAGFTG